MNCIIATAGKNLTGIKKGAYGRPSRPRCLIILFWQLISSSLIAGLGYYSGRKYPFAGTGY
jgi:hypothetical protein